MNSASAVVAELANRLPLIEPALGAGGVVLGRQKQQREKISALEMRAFFLELRLALHIDERRDRIGEHA